MEWQIDGSKWTLHHTWETGIDGIPLIDVRFVNHWNEKLVIMIFQDGLSQPWREVVCEKQSCFPDPLATLDCNGQHTIEVRLRFPDDRLHDKQTLKLFVDGENVDGGDFDEEDVDESPERTVDEILAAVGLESCIPAFRFEGITTEDELRLLTDEQMKELGVAKMVDRNRLRTHFTPLPDTAREVQPAKQGGANNIHDEMRTAFAKGFASRAGAAAFGKIFS